MAVMVRNAWLSAKPETSASSMAQAAREESRGASCDGGRGVDTGAGLQKEVGSWWIGVAPPAAGPREVTCSA
ncbi:hypothetical protein ACINB_02050 [Acidovorax sp. NB1]|nr:hypothetical protein ACINB_02050 [Acidovorax sp. NB1]